MISAVIGAISLSNVSPDTPIDKDCDTLLKSKGYTNLTLQHLFENHGRDYWRVYDKKLSISFSTNASLPDNERDALVNELKSEKIEEWCSNQDKKYADLPLIPVAKK